MLTDADSLVAALWAIFLDEIAESEPVTFCFSQETIKEQLAEAGLSGEQPISQVNAVARGCFEIEGEHVSLLPSTLVRGASGFSKAIVLVCQQILAVEEMVREGGRFTENAYFPRLRAMMSPELAPLSANPFSFTDFESIWRAFAREVRSQPGASDDVITFEFNQYAGINKARWFPLSQALFSKSDLNEILAHCRLEYLRSGSERDIWREIRRERGRLSRRGHRLVNSGFLQARLIEQVRRYATRVAPVAGSSRSGNVQRIEKAIIAVALESQDWFNQEHVACLLSSGTGRRVENSPYLEKQLQRIVSESGYAVLCLDDFGDHWIYRDGLAYANPGVTILVIGHGSGLTRAHTVLDSLAPPITFTLSPPKFLGASKGLSVCSIAVPNDLPHPIAVRAGRIDQGASVHASTSPYVWIGGVCLDSRSHKYLKVALPESIRFGPHVVSLNSMVRINGLSMSWASLKRMIEKLEADASYDIEFTDGNAARLAIAASDKSGAERMGFAIDVDGFLSPTLDRLGELDIGVIGFRECGLRPQDPMPLPEVASLLREVKSARFANVATAPLETLIRRVMGSSAPTAVKVVLVSLLRRNCAPMAPGKS